MEAPHRARQKSKARRLRKPGYVPHRALTTRIKPSGRVYDRKKFARLLLPKLEE